MVQGRYKAEDKQVRATEQNRKSSYPQVKRKDMAQKLSQERHLAWSCHLPKVRASVLGACRALSLTAAPAAAGLPP